MGTRIEKTLEQNKPENDNKEPFFENLKGLAQGLAFGYLGGHIFNFTLPSSIAGTMKFPKHSIETILDPNLKSEEKIFKMTRYSTYTLTKIAVHYDFISTHYHNFICNYGELDASQIDLFKLYLVTNLISLAYEGIKLTVEADYEFNKFEKEKND